MFAVPDGRRAIADALLQPLCAERQYQLGCLVQRQHNAGGGGSFGDATSCEQEARAWFLAVATHGHAGAHDAVASYFLTQPCGEHTFRTLRASYHDAAFHFWVAARMHVPTAAESLVDLTRNETQNQFLPLATKDVPRDALLDGEARQRLVRLLHLGPRLADAAREPYDDAAAQFLLATQHLGTPQPCVVARYTQEPVDDDAGGVLAKLIFSLEALRDASVEEAHRLLRRSAAQLYAMRLRRRFCAQPATTPTRCSASWARCRLSWSI